MPLLRIPPAEVLLSWPPPNASNPQIISPGYPGTVLFLMSLTFIIVLARVWVRGFIQRDLRIDDYLIIIAEFAVLAVGICDYLALTRYGFNKHIWDAILHLETSLAGRQVSIAMEISYMIATGLTKLSILFLVVRIGGHAIHPTVYLAARLTMVFCTLSTVTFVILPFVECRPLEALWMQVDYIWASQHHFKCLDEGLRVVSAGAISVLQDFIVATIPLAVFWNLQMSWKKKLVVSAVFCGGYLSCIFGVMRLIFSYRLFYVTWDPTWEGAKLFLWTALELHTGVICTSLPAVKLLFQHCRSRIHTISSSRKGSSGRAEPQSVVPSKDGSASCGSHEYGLHRYHTAARMDKDSDLLEAEDMAWLGKS